MNILIVYIYEHFIDLMDYETLAKSKEKSGDEALDKKKGRHKDTSQIEELNVLKFLKYPLIEKQLIKLRQADWVKALDFKPTKCEYTIYIENLLEMQKYEDSQMQ